MANICGRFEEINLLNKIYHSKKPEFLTVYGRRRVGKTHLISNFFKNKGVYFELTGTKDARLAEQLNNFTVEFSRVFYKGQKQNIPHNWLNAFEMLWKEIELIQNQKIILFFDELPWLSSSKSGFIQAIDHYWNRYFSRKPNIVLIACGSAASWMIKNIISHKGGLHGRITRKMRLLPFSLLETENFLIDQGINLDRKQIIQLYMAVGGVAKYLLQVEKGKSVSQIIQDLCFSQQGYLYSEFHQLYSSLFDHSENHIKVIRNLAKYPGGLTVNALLKKTGFTSGGWFSDILRELEESNFIAYIPAYGKKTKDGCYRLIDEYSLFYLTWMDDVPGYRFRELDKNYWNKKASTQAFVTWSGYSFESICHKHIECIKEGLGIKGVSTVESGYALPSKTKSQRGSQIDLVIDRDDNCINLCEIKYYKSHFSIDKEYAKKLEARKNNFMENTETKKTLFTTLITTYGIKTNNYYHKVVDNELTMDDLFRQV